MTRVIVVSVAAGGGHKTAMISITRTLREYASEVDVECFESKVESLESIHRNSYTFNEGVYDALYKVGDLKIIQDLSSVFLAPILKEIADEFRPTMLSGRYDVVVSTHFIQTYALLKLREELGAPVKILAYVPDFDESTVHFAAYKGVRPDAAIAQSPRLLAKLHKRLGVPRSALQQAGYITRQEFTDLRALSKEQALARLQTFPFESVSALERGKRTFVAAGGSMWVSEIYKEIKILSESPDFLWEQAQILVVCGNNAEAYGDYCELQRELVLRGIPARIVPLPFLNAEQLATVYRASDAVMLSGIAPATMYELIEAEAGQPVIRRVNPGPERFNLKYILDRNLALYTPTRDEFLDLFTLFSRSSEALREYNARYRPFADRERALAESRARAMAKFIVSLASGDFAGNYRISPRYSLGTTFVGGAPGVFLPTAKRLLAKRAERQEE